MMSCLRVRLTFSMPISSAVARSSGIGLVFSSDRFMGEGNKDGVRVLSVVDVLGVADCVTVFSVVGVLEVKGVG